MHNLHFPIRPLLWGTDRGATLLSWTPSNAVALVKPKPSLLPVLVLLFLISYGLLALLVVEQGRTIDSQRSLIQSLFDDSTQLTQLKSKTAQKQRAAEAQAQAEAKAHSQAQAPSSQAQSSQAPSSQERPRDNAKSEHSTGKMKKLRPQKPPTDTADTSDERRMVVSI